MPVNALPGMGPVAVGFADFAEEAYDARVYLRWEIESSCDERQFSSQLCLCKAKVPPLEGLTTHSHSHCVYCQEEWFAG